MRTIITLCIVMLTPFICLSQHGESNESDVASKEHGKEKGIYEIITSGIYNYSPESKHGNFGSEFHFTYWFNHNWGTGLSYTAIFEEDLLVNEIALLGSWNPAKWCTLNVGPNFTLPNDHNNLELGAYGEIEFNIRPVKWVHFGPVLGTVIGHTVHFNIGYHLGFEF